MTEGKRGSGVAMFFALLLAVSALGYGVAAATGQLSGSASAASSPLPTVLPEADPTSQPAPAEPTEDVAPTEPQTPEAPETPETPAAPAAILAPGDSGPQVRELQSRLREILWYAGKVTDTYGPETTAAVEGFQAKRGLPATGEVDRKTWKRLTAMTHEPTKAELANKISDGTWTDAPLDARCRTGRAMCVDKTSRTIRWVVDGEVLKTMAVRFGSSYTPTREGAFSVDSKSRNHVSSLYDTSMPFAMFFSRGQAVHFSPDFAAVGYNGASHGCVNVRDYDGIAWLFDKVKVGDKVIVYRS